jgi:hypothetical protein
VERAVACILESSGIELHGLVEEGESETCSAAVEETDSGSPIGNKAVGIISGVGQDVSQDGQSGVATESGLDGDDDGTSFGLSTTRAAPHGVPPLAVADEENRTPVVRTNQESAGCS